MKTKSPIRNLSIIGAWALAFGCSVGWDATVIPWTEFLPKAGPLGTALGLAIGGLVMAVIAWNFHFMINRNPGPGGVYAYATEAFGHDHGYLCAWFLCLTYITIVWSDATAMPILLRYMLGKDFFSFGFRYSVEGYEVCLGDILIAVFTSVFIVSLCLRRRVSIMVQTVLAVVFAVGFLACFSASAVHGAGGGLDSLRPLFAANGGSRFFQVLNILAIAPWLFVGFETIASFSGEFRFPLKKSFGIMVATLVSTVIAYVVLAAIPVFVSGGDHGGWAGAIANIGDPDVHAFDAASRSLGRVGTVVICITLFGAILTNLIGNTIVASRLFAAMADDGALPSWFGKRNADGSPRNAILAIAGLAFIISPFGKTVIGVIVDIGIIGAAVAYAYTSAATLRLARKAGNRLAAATGLVGLLFSVVIGLLFILPVFSSELATMATESYILLVLWAIIGIAFFLFVFRRDRSRRFGRSSVVWISLFLMIVVLSVLWTRQATHDTTKRAYEAIVKHHSENCLLVGHGGERHVFDDWRASLRNNLRAVNGSVIRNNVVQGGLNLLALVLMFALYRILRRRERDMENEKAKAKSYFFSTVSHDIRTPLNAIIGFSEMLKNGFKTEAEQNQAIDSILVSGKTLLGLINDVLDLSKLESGKMDILPEPTDCQRLMKMVMSAFSVSNRNTSIELRCRAVEMPFLMLDPQRMRQIVFNLLGNAVKFTEKGYVELRASFVRHEDAEAGELRIEVEDTGCGISEENLKILGSAYVQVGTGISRNGGTGLGLAICKQLASAMGGRLEIKSKLGAGSTFAIVLPRVEIAPQPADAQKDVAGESRSGAAETARVAPLPRRILIVDDSKMNLMVLMALLKHLGDFEVEVAIDGREALKILQAPDAKPFDLVLTDMWMPNLDGEGLIRAIRANPALASLRVMAVTADVESQGASAAMGFDGMLLKPVTMAKLGKMMDNWERGTLGVVE